MKETPRESERTERERLVKLSGDRDEWGYGEEVQSPDVRSGPRCDSEIRAASDSFMT